MVQDREPIPKLSVINRHPKTINGPRLLHELVCTSSSATELAIDFLEDGSTRRKITYEELQAKSDALASKITAALSRLKHASAIVPVLLPQSPELYISLLAILKAGRAFCPIGLDTPAERLKFILKDVSANLVITDSAHIDYVPAEEANVQVLRVDIALSECTYCPDKKAATVMSDSLAYVLYTSGSTGQPKAVAVSHRAVTQSLLAHDRHIPRFSRFLQFASPTFDVSIFEIFFPLYRGGTLVGCNRAQMLNDLPRVISEMAVDAAELTPTVVSNLLKGRKSVPGLKLLLTIGEMLTRHVVDEFGGHGPTSSILWAMYGPTEAAIHCTLQPSFSADSPVGNIGFPLDTVSALVATSASEEKPASHIEVLPVGETGELILGGPQIADGYLNRPELASSSFIEHPKLGLLYRTGDKVRLRPDGTLECLGRIVSGQVKLRGQRVELGEIEQTILKLSACHAAVVTIIDDTLVAFCATSSPKLSSANVTNICKRWLPGYMVPAEVILVRRIPQLASGKADKKALQAQYLRGRRQKETSVAEWNDYISQSFLEAFRGYLSHTLSMDTSLASVGLDSLRAIRIASTIREHGYKVGAVDILSASSVRELIAIYKDDEARFMEAPGESSTSSPIALQIPELRGDQAEISGLLRCTPVQEAMLAETIARPRAYCNWVEVELSCHLTFPQIRFYIEKLAEENEILRSGFFATTSSSGSFAQVVWKTLGSSSIREVTSFSKTYSLGTMDSLLRPLTIQVIVATEKPRLLFQIHHALYDGWSFDLLLRDLNLLVAGSALESRPQYRDVMRYYSQAQKRGSLTASGAYWAGLLRDYHPKPFPNLNGRVVQSNKLYSVRGESRVDIQSLVECAQKHRIDPQVFFQAATAYVLALYVGSTDVVIGSVTSGRTIPVTNIERIIGPCIASLPFRLNFSSCSTIKDILHTTQRRNRDMLPHYTLPLRDILKNCKLRPGQRLFDALFVWQQPLMPSDDGSVPARIIDSADELEFRVTLEFEPCQDRILFRFSYDPAMIPEKQVKYLSHQIDDVVEHFLANADSSVEDIGQCFSNDTVSVANPSPQSTRFSRGPTYAVEKRALESPDKAALIFGTTVDGVMHIKEALTYKALNTRANQLAHVLQEHGVDKDQPICVLMEKSIDLYVSILAVLKIGCGYLPIVPDSPLERTKRILADAEVTVCISQSSTSESVRHESCTVFEIDKLDLSRYPDHNPDMRYDGSHLAYAVFTSGSTGRPKGVLVTQDNLMSNLEYLASVYPISSDSRMLQSCSQAFDVSVFEIFFSWYVGMCLCTATKDDLFHDFEAAINRLQITHLSLTPTVAALVDPSKVPKVKFLVTAGEALTESVRRKWAGKGLFQGYGPSETTNICTVRSNVTPDDLINNIGPPFANTSLLVLAPGNDTIVPRGAIGELCFGGAQVFRGYLKMPEMNASKIINHPRYGRMYRSGDMGVLLSDDAILCIGRLDDQVKIRGQRVELGEITSVVLDHPSVKDCVTLLFQYDSSVQRLVVFWVPMRISANESTPLPVEEFRPTILDIFQSLSLQVPSYMVPSHLIPISQIPMTTQTKVDKRTLRLIFDKLSKGYLESTAPGWENAQDHGALSAAEQMVAEILARTVDRPLHDIRRASSFFNLGLDSISAIRFAKLLAEGGLGTIPVSVILKNPTVGRLSSIVLKGAHPKPALVDDFVALSPVFLPDQLSRIRSVFTGKGMQIHKILPCTPLQEAMMSSSSSASSYYNMMVFNINGNLSRMKEAWACMYERHEIFRTAFLPTDDAQFAFAQVVLAHEPLQWVHLNPMDDLKTYVDRSLSALIRSHKPPVQLAIQGSGSSSRLIFCCHHALYDGTAIDTLLNEAQEVYLGSKLPPPVTYECYLQHVVSQNPQAADRFWVSSLAGFEPKFFPHLSARAHRPTEQSSCSEKVLHISLSEALNFCRGASISLLSVMQAAWTKLLSFCMGENDLCFGNVVGGRMLPEDGIDRLVAPCFNTLPVRVKFDFQKPNLDLCHKLHEFNVESLPFQLTPLRQIQAKTSKEKGHLFDTLFILQQPSTPLNSSIWSLEQDIGHMDFPLVCELSQDKTADTMKLVLHYQDSRLLTSDAEELMEIFDNALRSLVGFPNSAASDTVGFPTRLLAQSDLYSSHTGESRDRFLHAGFERNTVLRPNGVALDFQHTNGERTTLTFKALNELANRIAHALLQSGVMPEDIVPVHMSKSPKYYAAILGILKAGGAFAPIHPDLPEARKRLMLSELQPRVVVCTTDALGWSKEVPLLNINTVQHPRKDNPLIANLRSTNLAYCLYTSGSTGIPKAVCMEHRAPIQTIESSRSLIPWSFESRLLQYAATTFDMCYYDCFLAWTFGFALCAADEETMLNNLTDTINSLHVDLLDLTPSVVASLSRVEVPSVKWLYCIGEPMTTAIIDLWAGACVNSYGPTEAAFCTSIFPVRKDIKTSVIGKPFPTASFAVFPPHGDRPVPILGLGELYIGGAQLARGYYGKPELTDEKYVQKCGQRFYKTGDIVRMLSDGNFEFLGRADDQVKIRGLRVELGEISHVLEACDGRILVVTTHIFKVKNSAKDQLVTFLVSRYPCDQLELSELRYKVKQAATSQLPTYMVPQFFVFTDRIPKSMAGKVDKHALLKIFRESEEVRTTADEAGHETSRHTWTETEDKVRHIFSKLSKIQVEEITPTTSIYQLGLDSISAVQIAAVLRRQGLPANATDVMRLMNCRDIAAYIEQKHASLTLKSTHENFDFASYERTHRAEVLKTSSIPAEDVEAIRPCTYLQNGMLSQFVAKDGAIYFNYIRLRLQDDVDLVRMRNAWSSVVRRHPMLRTGFAHVKNSNNPFAMIHYNADALSLPWDRNDDLLVEAWLEELRRKAVKQLHRPPWCVRVAEAQGVCYLDLALLHALFDAQSLRLIFDDITHVYNDQALDSPAPLEPLLADIIRSSSHKDVQRNDFWKRHGEGATPTRFPNMSPLRYDPAPPAVVIKSSSKTLADLDLGCRKVNTSVQAVGIASWATLLSAYTGEASVTFGVVLSGRNLEAAGSAVFPCITTVPFTCRVEDDKKRMMSRVLEKNAEIQQHQFTPLNEIQRLMGYANEPLFDTIFAFQKMPGDNIEDLWTVVDERATIEYPISIELEPKAERLEYRLTFLPHIVPEKQAMLILDQLDHLIEYFIFSDVRSAIHLHDNQVLYSVTPAKEPMLSTEASLLHEMFELTASRHPNRTALEYATSMHNERCTSIKWTYAELDWEGNRIAHVLISHGIRPGNLVGVCFDKCPEAFFAMLGILKAGCAFVALDPGAPSARKTFIIKDSGAACVLSVKSQSADVHGDGTRIFNLDEYDWQSAPTTKPSLERGIDAKDRSYCLYTSGTTGTPKGCELTHENAVQALLSFQRLFAGHWNHKSRWLQFAAFHFDVSVLEQYWSWSVGICVVSAPRDLIFEDLASSIRSLGITHIDLTPSLARILHPDDVPSLCNGVFITGGESLKQEILDVWGPKGVIYNGYGPTEATIGVTMYPRVPANGKPSNIGPQFDNVGSYVLRPGSEEPILRGGIGELCVSGKLVGKGYLSRPDLTNDRFPHLARFNERVYRTGDLVRIFHDGTFDFLGRADDQVKLRGQRLEIAEINSVIKQCGIAVSDVATLILKHQKQQKDQLVAFVVAGSSAMGESAIVLETTNDLQRAKEACQEKLPPYMVPTHFVPLTAMPLSANNKVDGRKLRFMYDALSVSDLQRLSQVSAPKDEKWSKQEAKLQGVLRGVLHTGEDEMDKDASFFELGMDSISVIGVSRALKEAGFSRASVSLILKNPAIRRLAMALSSRDSTSNDRGSIIAAQQAINAVQHHHRRAVAETLFIDTRKIEALAPCTPLQQGMIARSLDSEHGLYFNTFQLGLSDNVDQDKLRMAWEDTYSSTQILRTVFVDTEDGYMQAVLRLMPLRWNQVTLPEDDALDDYLGMRKKQWWQQNRTVIKSPFEVIFVATPERKCLVVHLFHAIYDGNSVELIFDLVWSRYNGADPIPSCPSFQSALAHGPLRPVYDAKEFWQGYLRDTSFRPFPPLTADSNGTLRSIRTTLEVNNAKELENVRRRLNVTGQAIVQACWTSILHRCTKATVILGMVVSGRSIDLEDADRVVGPLFNTIPYQYRPQSRETWASLIRKAHDFNVTSHPYQHTPLRDIMKWCRCRPDQPLFNTLFVYQVANGNKAWMKNDIWELVDGGAEADYPLAIEVEQRGEALKLTLVTQGHISKEETSNHLLDLLVEALREAVRNPDARLETVLADDDEHTEVVTHQDDERPVDSFDGTKDFVWTDYAAMIRKDIADLAGVNIDDVTELTSIFELGLDSIDSIRLSSKLKKRGIILPVSVIMRSLTIPNMLQHMSNNKPKWHCGPSDMIFKSHTRRLESYLQRRGLVGDAEKILPLTPLQEAMVADMIASDYTRYYNHDVLELGPDTDVEKLRKAWEKVVKNSPILRTTFIEVDDPGIDFSFAQVIHQSTHTFWASVEVDDVPNFPRIFESIREGVVKDSAPRPLFNVRLIRSPSQAYLVLSIAHALYDGWSLSLLHSDVYQSYVEKFKPRPSYERTLCDILTTSGADAVAFWRDYLSDARPSTFPRQTALISCGRPAIHRKEQSSGLALAQVASFAKNHSVTLQTLGQTVFALVLASYTQSLDVTFGSVLSGRDDDERARLLFPTMNTVAIRAILHGSCRDMLEYVQDNFANLKQWQHFPLRKAFSLAGAQGSLFESLFIYQKNMDGTKGEGTKLYKSVQSRSDVEYPVCVEMEVIGKELKWRCALKEEVFDAAGAHELLNKLDTVLRKIVEEPLAPTIDFTADGTSICGLPPFESEGTKSEEGTSNAEDHTIPNFEPTTAKAIREVLALVSKTPEHEITEGMTIFHIGLDSISAIKVSSLLRKRSIVLNVGDMLKAGTVEKMARVVDERAPTPEQDHDNIKAALGDALAGIDQATLLKQAGIKESDVERVLPATAGQVYMLSMWLTSNGAVFYSEFSYQVRGSIPITTLRAGWRALVAANPILRTCLLATKDKRTPYVQVMLRRTESTVLDVTGCGTAQRSKTMAEAVLKQPYVHLSASRTSTGWELKLRVHHSLYDGVSLPLLMLQFQALCSDTNAEAAPNAFVNLIASASSSESVERRKFFWENYLKGLDQHAFRQPTSLPTSKVELFEPGLVPSISGLENLVRKHGITTQSLFLAVYAKVYATLTSTPTEQDVVIGIYLANRSLPVPDLAQSAVPTVNLVPIRVSAPRETAILDVAAQIQYDIQEISSLANVSVSLWEIEEWTGLRIDTFVNFLKLPDADESGVEHNGVEMVQAGKWGEPVCRITEIEHGETEAPQELVNDRINKAYVHAVDIEATIRNGALDVGVFAPEEMLGLEEAEKMVKDIRMELEDLAKGTG